MLIHLEVVRHVTNQKIVCNLIKIGYYTKPFIEGKIANNTLEVSQSFIYRPTSTFVANAPSQVHNCLACPLVPPSH